MSRQIEEEVEILNSKADVIMNAKGEWNGSKLPRIIIERGERHKCQNDELGRDWDTESREEK